MIKKLTIIFIFSILIGIFAALWGLSTQTELGSSQKEIHSVALYYGIEGFAVVWIIALLGMVFDRKHKSVNKSNEKSSITPTQNFIQD